MPRTYSTHCIAKRYRLPRWVVKVIRKQAPLYGSLGRTIQVGTELLIRRKKPVKVNHRGEEAMMHMTYKLTPRTAVLIEELTAIYGERADVFVACVNVLNIRPDNKQRRAQ